MASLVAQAATAHTLNEADLRQSLQTIAQRSYASEEDIERALEEAWKHGVAHSMADGIMSQVEETKLRDRLDTAGMIQPA